MVRSIVWSIRSDDVRVRILLRWYNTLFFFIESVVYYLIYVDRDVMIYLILILKKNKVVLETRHREMEEKTGKGDLFIWEVWEVVGWKLKRLWRTELPVTNWFLKKCTFVSGEYWLLQCNDLKLLSECAVANSVWSGHGSWRWHEGIWKVDVLGVSGWQFIRMKFEKMLTYLRNDHDPKRSWI